MKKDTIYLFIIFLLVMGFVAYRWKGNNGNGANPSLTDTTTYVDTVKYFQPIPRDSLVIRYKTVKLPIADSAHIAICDTIIKDSIDVVIPITQKEYRDSAYHLWISGFQPSLDSIKVFNRYSIVTKENTLYKTKKWGLGIQVGYGWNGTQTSPYIGVGVSYNFFSW